MNVRFDIRKSAERRRREADGEPAGHKEQCRTRRPTASRQTSRRGKKYRVQVTIQKSERKSYDNWLTDTVKVKMQTCRGRVVIAWP